MPKTLDAPKVVVHFEHCKGCGLCVLACPRDVLYQSDGFNSKGYHPAVWRGEGCIGCGMCYYACPEPDAITVYKKGAEYSD
jgi:NAD-dependent dihydropyrimidine dehydrogenase PreA subunit